MRVNLQTLTAAFAPWLIPISIPLFGRNDKDGASSLLVGIIWLVLALLICFTWRKARWVALIWVPLVAFTVIVQDQCSCNSPGLPRVAPTLHHLREWPHCMGLG